MISEASIRHWYTEDLHKIITNRRTTSDRWPLLGCAGDDGGTTQRARGVPVQPLVDTGCVEQVPAGRQPADLLPYEQLSQAYGAFALLRRPLRGGGTLELERRWELRCVDPAGRQTICQ